MIDVEQAVRIGREYLRRMYEAPSSAGTVATPLLGLLLEEVELDDDELYWYVTFGWDLDRLGTQRTYKVLKLRASDGQVMSMKIREVS